MKNTFLGRVLEGPGADREVDASDGQLNDAIGVEQSGVDQLNETRHRVKVGFLAQIVQRGRVLQQNFGANEVDSTNVN